MGKYCTVCRESPVKPVYSSQGLHFILDYPSADYPTNYLNVTLFFCFLFLFYVHFFTCEVTLWCSLADLKTHFKDYLNLRFSCVSKNIPGRMYIAF